MEWEIAVAWTKAIRSRDHRRMERPRSYQRTAALSDRKDIDALAQPLTTQTNRGHHQHETPNGSIGRSQD